MIVALCGFMGCGKSTVGKILAEKMHLNFYDTDAAIEQSAGRSIQSLFEEYGEATFRTLEKNAIRALLEKDGSVLSLGGGAVKDQETVDILHQKAVVVFINTSFEQIKKHIAMDKHVRPLAANSTQEDFLALYQSRLPLYQAAAHFEVFGDGSAEEVTEKIMDLIKKF